VNVETSRFLAAEDALRVLCDAPGVVVTEEAEAGPALTLADAVGADATLVGRLRQDLSVEAGLSFWVAIDGARKGAAVNAVQIAELLVRDYL